MSTLKRLAVIGCRGPGLWHAKDARASDRFQVVAMCDRDAALAEKAAAENEGSRPWSDAEAMLRELKPDAVSLTTGAVPRARLTALCLDHGVRGIYAEKPMAVSLGEGRAMIDAARRRGAVLVVNHQRRTYPAFIAMKRALDAGAVGKIELVRGSCAGDVLSDGTHTIDCIRYLLGDPEITAVLAQIYRAPAEQAAHPDSGDQTVGGYRYGHAIETGAMAVIDFAGNLRAEIFCGLMQPRGRRYQDFEVFGSTGRLWRAGDQADPPVQAWDQSGGGWRAVPVDLSSHATTGATNYAAFADAMDGGPQHPLDGSHGLKDLEAVMAVYESARTHRRVALPLTQERYPLDLMIEAGLV